MKTLPLLLVAALLSLAAPPLSAGECDTVGTITAIESKPVGFRIKRDEDTRKSDEDAPPQYYRVETASATNWSSFEVGDRVQVTCKTDGEMGDQITRIAKARPKR